MTSRDFTRCCFAFTLVKFNLPWYGCIPLCLFLEFFVISFIPEPASSHEPGHQLSKPDPT